MVHWVRNWIVEGDIKINKNGAMGWVDQDGHLFMVCRSLADKIIHHCDAMGITDIPRDPIRLYDILHVCSPDLSTTSSYGCFHEVYMSNWQINRLSLT